MTFSLTRVDLLVAAGLIAASGPSSTAQAAAPACDTPQHHQFDFWVGRWDVYRADTNKLVAHSLIEKLYGGCAVRENWMPLAGGDGGSLNSYRPTSKEWHQLWTDSANDLDEYSGGIDAGKMVLTGTSSSPSGEVAVVRMVFEPRPDGSVAQTGYGSTDNGKSWQLQYKYIYRHSGGN